MCSIFCCKYWRMGDLPILRSRTVDFKNTVIVMTSKSGQADYGTQEVGLRLIPSLPQITRK